MVRCSKIPYIIILQTLVLALYIDIRSVNWALTKILSLGEGIMSLLYIATISLLIIFMMKTLKYTIRSLSKYSIFLVIFLCCFYLITNVFIKTPVVSIQYFLIFTIASFLIPQLTIIDSSLLLKAIMLYPAFSILKINDVFSSYVTWSLKLPMDVSYGFQVPIIATITYVFMYYKTEHGIQKLVTILTSVINFIFLGYILLFGSRGPIIGILLLICMLWCVQFKNNGLLQFNVSRFNKILMLTIICGVFFIGFITAISNFLGNYGIEVDAIQKMIYLNETNGDLSNGRNNLTELAWNGFVSRPIWGHGLDQFDNNYPESSYPHNFVLQILYDGGLILLIILLPILIIGLKRFKSYSYDQFAIFCTFFCASVPGALFSQNLWNMPLLWMCFGFIISKTFIYNKPIINTISRV